METRTNDLRLAARCLDVAAALSERAARGEAALKERIARESGSAFLASRAEGRDPGLAK